MFSVQPAQMYETLLAVVMMCQGDHVCKKGVVIIGHCIVEKPEASGDQVLDNITSAKSRFHPGCNSLPSPLSQTLCITADGHCLIQSVSVMTQ